MADFLPRRDAELATWAANFARQIAAEPARYGLDEGQSAEMTQAQQAFAAAYQTARNPETRTVSNILAKDAARQAMKTIARRLARIVHASPGVSDEMKITLGLAVRSANGRTSGLPQRAPRLDVKTTTSRRTYLRLRDPDSRCKGKPRGTIGAMIFSYVGDRPSTKPEDWVFVCNTTRITRTVSLPAHLRPGTRVWFTAAWLDSRLRHGCWSTPAGVQVMFGGVAAAGATLPAVAA